MDHSICPIRGPARSRRKRRQQPRTRRTRNEEPRTRNNVRFLSRKPVHRRPEASTGKEQGKKGDEAEACEAADHRPDQSTTDGSAWAIEKRSLPRHQPGSHQRPDPGTQHTKSLPPPRPPQLRRHPSISLLVPRPHRHPFTFQPIRLRTNRPRRRPSHRPMVGRKHASKRLNAIHARWYRLLRQHFNRLNWNPLMGRESKPA